MWHRNLGIDQNVLNVKFLENFDHYSYDQRISLVVRELLKRDPFLCGRARNERRCVPQQASRIQSMNDALVISMNHRSTVNYFQGFVANVLIKSK